jgi:hypothetical protein
MAVTARDCGNWGKYSTIAAISRSQRRDETMLTQNKAKGKQAQAATVHGSGIVKGNPKLCLHCLKPIRKGEAWTKHTSRDREYSVIVHDNCNGKA